MPDDDSPLGDEDAGAAPAVDAGPVGAVDLDGGSDTRGEPTPPGFRSLTAGWGHTCAVRNSDDEVVCWGSDDARQLEAEWGRMASVSAGGRATCGLDLAGATHCWGEQSQHTAAAPSKGAYTSVAVGSSGSCALDDVGSLDCWGDLDAPDGLGVAIPEGTPVAKVALAANGGPFLGCALTSEDRSLICFGLDLGGRFGEPGTFDSERTRLLSPGHRDLAVTNAGPETTGSCVVDQGGI